MTATDGTSIWRPYVDRPVLTSAMVTGHRTTPAMEVARLRRYLEAVVAARGCPVHTAVAFNAAYFGYATGGEGYGNGPFGLDDFPVLTLGDEGTARPVGALVRIHTGSDPLYAEIVYKEGRHPAIREDGEVPAWVSGAPATAQGPGEQQTGSPVRRELLVPDFTAFGPALELDDTKLKRLRSRGKWLDENGHVMVDASYAPQREAMRDDTTTFVDYLLAHQRDWLLSPLVPASVAHLADGGDEERLRSALTGLLDVIDHALRTADGLRSWGPYALSRARVGAGLRQDGPLGSADLGALAGSLEQAAAPSTRRRHGLGGPRTAYTAISPWLRGMTGVETLITGTEYAVSVCRANIAVTDFLRSDTDDGLLTGSDVRITLDDSFENGGIWRSRHPGAEDVDGSDPLVPAGRGWRDTIDPPAPRTVEAPARTTHENEEPSEVPTADIPPADVPLVDAPLVDAPVTDQEDIGLTNYLRVNDSEICWQQPLRLAHLMEDRLPLSRMARDALAYPGSAPVTVRLEIRHDGVEIDPSEEVQQVTLDVSDASGMLRGVQWPIDFFPGLRLYLQWPRGGAALRLSTVELEEPVDIDGQLFTHRYDPQVMTRDGAPGSARDSDSPSGLDDKQLVLRAVRRFGRLTDDGHALLDRDALPRAIYDTSPAPDQVTAVERALADLITEGLLYTDAGSRGANGEPHHPPRDGEPLILLVGYAPAPVVVPRPASGGGGLPQGMGIEYVVHGFLRRLPQGREPSDAQRAAYRASCRRVGKADGWELPRGYTFVTSHVRRR
ncbi:hypothetical protein OG462_41690 [Streptomyces sp. NBC_01077]|uniref:hypothetical protein n=1 Tax=Streptomyces sp. NBC_01077 TaxID=2903746 RepID=UPI0038666C9D|nr:hypothetical protein OG462_41690 [Streptomyces sp. NBC_01077]